MELSGDALKMMGQSLERLISSKTVIGEPIVIKDVTLVPVVDVMFGLGSAGGGGPDAGAQGRGAGFGTGARISPRAVIVVRKDQVDVYPLSVGGPVERILDRLPGLTGTIIDRIKEATRRSSEEEEVEEEHVEEEEVEGDEVCEP